VSEPTTADHPVYPGGPPCNPYCEGDWSTYHDGYGDGYDRADREARALLLDELEAHIPRGGGDANGYGFVACSCGWDDLEPTSWVEHLRAALIQQHREAIR
jgi:hypothetical protein